MAELHDQDEEVMRAKLFASMKKKTLPVLESKKSVPQTDAKPNTADKIFIKSFDQIMREKKAVDNNNINAGSSDDQGVKEKGLNRKRAVDLKNRQRELVLARKQAKVAANSQASPAAESTTTTAMTRAKRAGQPLGLRSRLDKPLTEPAPSKPAPASTSPVLAPSSQAKSPTAQATPSLKSMQIEPALSLNNDAPAANHSQSSPAKIGSKQPFEVHLEALRREIELANKIIDEFAQMNVPEFRDLNLDMVHDDDHRFIENMSSFLAGTVS